MSSHRREVNDTLSTSPRIRFNWGYHDGAGDVANRREIKVYGRTSRMTGKPWKPDKIYLQGYEYGVEDARNGVYTGNSDAAWKSRTSLRRAPWMPHRRAY